MKLILSSLIIGALAGLLGALCGVGGGIVMVPAFSALGMAHKNAIATSLAVIVVTSLVATVNNSRVGDLIDWRIVALTSVGAALAALTKIFGITLIIFGIKMLWQTT